MEAISFEVASSFGYFQWGKTKGDNRFTNRFISPTEVLGIIGAVIGSEGYAQRNFREFFREETRSTFYEELAGLKVAIIPKSSPVFYDDHLIHRHMKHINTNGSLMVKMTALIKPKYKIVAMQGTVDDETFGKIKEYFINGWAEYVPYFGKNQFPVEISNAIIEELVILDVEEPKIVHSLYKHEDEDEKKKPRIIESHLTKEGEYFHREQLKEFKQGGTPHFQTKLYTWSSFKVQLNEDVDQYKTIDQEVIVFT